MSGGRRTHALEALYRAHAPDAKRLAFLLTSDDAAAQDIVQDAFVRLFRRFKDRKPPDAFAAYLRRTVVNLSCDARRRSGRERIALAREHASASNAVTDQHRDDRHEMWTSLQHLAPRVRAVLVLRYYLDLSEQQTADALDCSVGTVKSYAHRGLKALRVQMGDRDE